MLKFIYGCFTVLINLFFPERFNKMKASDDTYYVTVIEDVNSGAVIGSASLVKEQKFIHNCAAVS